MNKIIGLLLKDFLELKSYKKNFIVSLVIYLLLITLNADSNDMTIIGTGMIAFIFNIYALATFNYDEKNDTNKYILTLPVSKKEIILSKYILLILSFILGIICGSIFSISLYYLNIIKTINYKNFFESILGLAFAISLMQSLQIPCIYKYGAEKGRTQIYLIMMVAFVLLGIVIYLFPNINIPSKIDKFIPIILSFLIIINYYISYKISYKIYSMKEL